MKRKTFLVAVVCALLVSSTWSFELDKIHSTDYTVNSECFELLDILATMEGFDYSNVDIAKRLFGNEKINFEVKTWRGKCYYGIGTLDGKVVIVSNKLFKRPTLLAFSDSNTVKMLFRNPSEKLFEEAIKTGKIRIEGVGFADRIKVGLTNIMSRYYTFSGKKERENETINVTLLAFNLSWQNDYDGDGILNSEDVCDPYLLKENLGADPFEDTLPLVKYYACPSFSLFREEYTGNTPYLDIYDYVMDNGCGVKDTDGGIRYYTKGRILVEDVHVTTPELEECKKIKDPVLRDKCIKAVKEDIKAGKITPEIWSRCKRVYTDYCLDDETLVEYYYEAPRRVLVQLPPNVQQATRRLGIQAGVTEVWVSGGIRNITYKCPFGCSNGACICEDVDASGSFGRSREERGKNYEVRGEYDWGVLIDVFGTSPIELGTDRDHCIDAYTLREFYVTVEEPSDPYIPDRCVLKSEEHACNSICEGGICKPATCSDGIKNQGEEGIDCGGPCPPCNTKCRTNVTYAPPDTPCTDKWRPPTSSNDKITTCEVFEVCDEKADKYIKEALSCCDPTFEQFIYYDPTSCNFAKANTPSTLPKKDYIKRCAALYIIKNMGDSSVPNTRKIMNYYMWEELCCNKLSSCNISTEFYNYFKNCISDNKSNFWQCWEQGANNLKLNGDYDAYDKIMERVNNAMGIWRLDQIPCTTYDLPKRWGDDNDPSKNTIKFAYLPSHATLYYLRTGTCADYAIAITTLLRKLGYTCDEVYYVRTSYTAHAFNFVKLPGDTKYHLVDTTGGSAGGIKIGGMYAKSKTEFDYANCTIKWLSICDRLNRTALTRLKEFAQRTGHEGLIPNDVTEMKNDCTGDYIPPITADQLYGCENSQINFTKLEEECG